MRDNLYCSNDNNVITKKFWAHVKSKTKSILEPEILGNHNINTGTTLLLKTIVN